MFHMAVSFMYLVSGMMTKHAFFFLAHIVVIWQTIFGFSESFLLGNLYSCLPLLLYYILLVIDILFIAKIDSSFLFVLSCQEL